MTLGTFHDFHSAEVQTSVMLIVFVQMKQIAHFKWLFSQLWQNACLKLTVINEYFCLVLSTQKCMKITRE